MHQECPWGMMAARVIIFDCCISCFVELLESIISMVLFCNRTSVTGRNTVVIMWSWNQLLIACNLKTGGQSESVQNIIALHSITFMYQNPKPHLELVTQQVITMRPHNQQISHLKLWFNPPSHTFSITVIDFRVCLA